MGLSPRHHKHLRNPEAKGYRWDERDLRTRGRTGVPPVNPLLLEKKCVGVMGRSPRHHKRLLKPEAKGYNVLNRSIVRDRVVEILLARRIEQIVRVAHLPLDHRAIFRDHS